jgi:hypothetical protein
MTLQALPTTLNPSKIEPAGVIKEAVNKTTKDLYLAAALHCEGCRYLGIDKTDPTRMIFMFEGGENADRVEREWYQDILAVSATAYAKSIRTMKSLIHS